jgi:hypothetical protein
MKVGIMCVVLLYGGVGGISVIEILTADCPLDESFAGFVVNASASFAATGT